MKTVVRATSKGQITLPAKWRKKFDTNEFLLEIQDNSLKIKPIDLDMLDDDEEGWETVIDFTGPDGRGVDINVLWEAMNRISKYG